MSAIVRKTYDTDSIVLRRIFAVDPTTNSRVSTNTLLVTGTNGQATFQDGSAYLSTIGFPTSTSLPSTIEGLGTFGYLSSGGGGGEVTKANLTSTTLGLGTLSYISSAQLTSSIVGLSNVAVTRIVAGTNVSISPTNGQGIVTINASGGGGTGSPVYDSEIASTLQKSGYFSSLALGYFAASTQQGANAIAIGKNAGAETQGDYATAIGYSAGLSTQSMEAVAIGNLAAMYAQGAFGIAIGSGAGMENQGGNTVAIGYYTALQGQGSQGVAIGQESGKYFQGQGAIGLGVNAGNTNQGRYSVAIGTGAGQLYQSSLAIAIGYEAGNLNQSFSSIAIGTTAGNVSQGKQAIAIGNSAGKEFQGDYSIAIGDSAGYQNLPHSTIVLSALGSNLTPSQPRAFHVAPIRDIDGTQTNSLGYNTSTYEIGLINSLTRLDLASTVRGLGTTGYVSTSQLTSTVAGISRNLSTVYNISSAGGVNISGTTTGFYINTAGANISTLINNNITINTTGGNVNDVDLTSTIIGLASFGYISTSQLTSSFVSTLTGLSNIAVTKIIAGTNVTINPVSGVGIVTINATGGGGGGSGDVTSTNLTSTTLGLGTLGYISASTLGFSLASTTLNLARLGYVSSTALPSTVLGLSRFYVSTTGMGASFSSLSTAYASSFFTRTLTASTVTADLLNVSTISFGTGSGFITFPFLRATYISSFSTQTDYLLVNRYMSGAQLQFSSIQGNGSLLTNLNTGMESTIRGLGTFGYISSPTLDSTIRGLGTFGYISSPTLDSTIQSTVEGLGSLGYISSLTLDSTLQSTVEGLGTVGFISSLTLDSTLQSTVEGLGTFYVSSFGNVTVSINQLIFQQMNLMIPPPGESDPPFFKISSVANGVGTVEVEAGLVNFRTTLLHTSSIFTFADSDITNPPTSPSTIFVGNYRGRASLGFQEPRAESGIRFINIDSFEIGIPYDTTFNQLPLSTLSSVAISTQFISTGQALVNNLFVPSSIFLNNAQLTVSSYISSTTLNNLQVNSLNVNSYGPVRVRVSTLGAAHANIDAYDIGRYFLFTQTNAGYSVALPTYNNSFEGWNCVIRNMPDSTQSFAISTVRNPAAGTNVAPGTTVTVVGSGNSYYIL